ncbi:hypothetical protein DUI87_30819 [Hirundo rustica rustica]|uniref:Uncharacterized protein n=1 Tax=Hirundo rustica rustica TaxID=333673 RepID=A0A3M0J1T9_HIRRU|nr:hypothetical protein DUI87_30819 [Hirundo rustica rustica]
MQPQQRPAAPRLLEAEEEGEASAQIPNFLEFREPPELGDLLEQQLREKLGKKSPELLEIRRIQPKN